MPPDSLEKAYKFFILQPYQIEFASDGPERDMAKQLLTPLRFIARMNFSLKAYSCELFNLIGTVGKVELISTFTTAVCESWNVSDKYT